MSKGKPRAAKRTIVGEYEISTGTARVVPDHDRDGAYVLEVNHVPSSPIVFGAPRILLFDYMRWAAATLDALLDRREHLTPPHLVHLGGAACTLPRYVADRWPTSTNTVVELDEKLAAYVREWFDFPAAPSVSLEVGEARVATHRLSAGSVDVLVRDVFAGGSTPLHLSTVEFFAAARRALSPGGLYLANHAVYPGLQTTRRELAGMREVFPHVAAVAQSEMFTGRGYGNMVLLGSGQPIDAAFQAAIRERLREESGTTTIRGEEWVTEVVAGAAPRRDRTSPAPAAPAPAPRPS